MAFEDYRQKRERLHTTVFSQCFSPCGRFLAACSNFGQISIFSLSLALSPGANEESWKPFFSFTAQDKSLYCLLSTNQFLISGGGAGIISAWNWSELLTKVAKVSWTLTIPTINNDQFNHPEINSLVVGVEDGSTMLFAGCGDNLVHQWNISTGSHVTSFQGHTDYIHSVALHSKSQQLLSASEDGSVRIWDARVGQEAIQIIEPHKDNRCNRPQLGKWVGCVAIDEADDWMVCGGGPQLSLWHLRSLTATTIFDMPNVSVNFAMFLDDEIVSGGNEKYVQHWSLNGDKRSQVPCSPSNVFNICVNDKSDNNKVLSVAGNCHKIDVCTNFGYKAFSLSFC